MASLFSLFDMAVSFYFKPLMHHSTCIRFVRVSSPLRYFPIWSYHIRSIIIDLSTCTCSSEIDRGSAAAVKRPDRIWPSLIRSSDTQWKYRVCYCAQQQHLSSQILRRGLYTSVNLIYVELLDVGIEPSENLFYVHFL